MTYLVTLTYPVAYQADSDDHARVIAEHIDDTLAGAVLPHAAEMLDAPGYVLEHSLTGRRHLRTVVGTNDVVARYAPLPPGTEHGCPACADYVASSNNPVPGVGLVAEIRDESTK